MLKKTAPVLLILFMIVPLFAGPLQVTVVKRGMNTASFGPTQRIYDKFIAEMQGNAAFTVKDDINLDKEFGIPITPDFSQIIDPVNIYEINRKTKIDLLVFFVASPEEITISTYDFPTGIELGSRSFSYNITDPDLLISDQKQYVSQMNSMLATQKHEYGFNFKPDDFGVLICTDDIHHIDLAKTMDLLNKQYFKNTRLSTARSLKYKIVEMRSITCGDLSSLCNDLDAELAFYFSAKNRNNHIVTFANTPIPANLTSVEYPIVPEASDMYCLRIDPTRYDVNTIVNIVVGDTELTKPDAELLPLYTYRTLQKHREWKYGNSRSNSIKNEIIQNYSSLENAVTSGSMDKAWINLNFAAFCRLVQDYNRADSLLTTALGLFLVQYETNGEILCRLEQARQLTLTGDWEEADRIYSRLLKRQSTVLDSVSKAEIYFRMGVLDEMSDNPEKAIQEFESSLSIYAHLQDSFQAMQPQLKLGQAYRKIGNYEQAEQSVQRYLTIANNLHSEPDIARARYEMGLINLANGQTDLALNDFTMAREMFDMLGESRFLSFIYLNLGAIQLQKEQYVKANINLNKAIEIAQQTRETLVLIDSYRYLGDTESEMQSWDKAQQFYDQAIDLAINNSMMNKVAELMYLKGLSHLRQGNVSIGYTEVKKGIEMSDGKVHGDRKKANQFLRKLEKIIAEKQNQLNNVNP